MCVQLKLLDNFKLTNHLGINFACAYSEDDRFFIINDTGVYILAFTGCVSNENPKFVCSKYFLHLSNFTPCNYVDLDINTFHSDLPKNDVYESVMKIEYSANLKCAKPTEPVPIYAEWSSKGLAEGNECFLAVLTNMFSLEVYLKHLNETEEVQYSLVTNITEAIIEIEKKKWSDACRFGIQMKYEEYKKRINIVSPSAFTWSHLLRINEINCCAIFCGHINGDISIWRLNKTYFNIPLLPTYLGRFHTQLKRITNLYWHQSTEYGGGLFISDVDGKLNVVHITNLNENEAVFHKEQIFFSEPDKIKIDKITVMLHNDCTFVIIVKQRILIIFGINKIGEIFDCTSVYIQEYYITGLQQFKNNLLVLSLPGLLTEVSLKIKNNKIMVEKSLISLKCDLEKFRTHGFFFSKNMVMCCIVAYPWDLQSFSKLKTFVNVFIYHNTTIKPFEVLWKNEKDSIGDFWDCFEVLRIICIKEKRFPWLGLPGNLNYDTLSVTKLKTLRLVARISEMLFNIIPSIQNYNIKPFILLHYLLELKLIVERMSRLLKQRKNTLTDFQMRSLFIQNFFLKEMIAKNVLPKANVGKTFIESIKSVMEVANELEYPQPLICAWCGDIFGPTCFPPHADSRCCISMMPIFILPEYKCPNCKLLAHKEVEKELFPVICPYCDKIMDKIYVDNKIKGSCEQFQQDLPTIKYSDCFPDCLKESIEYEEIEDNNIEFIIFSDSDDETNNIKELYEQFSKTQICEVKQEIVNVDS